MAKKENLLGSNSKKDEMSAELSSFVEHFEHSITKNLSLLLNDTNVTLNLCSYQFKKQNNSYLSLSYFYSHLPKSLRMNSYSLLNALNLIIQMLISNMIDCETYRLKQTNSNRIHRNLDYVNIFLTRKLPSNEINKQIQLVGRYSILDNNYQSCQNEKNDLFLTEKSTSSSKIYYITSLLDEPFLMLRKGTTLHEKYNHPQANMKELQGRIFNMNDLEGFCVDLAKEVCSILNISCKFRIAEDGNFGSKNKSTGIWDGKYNMYP